MKGDQKKAPILEAIEHYHQSEPLPFRVPGHKLGEAVDEPTASILPRAMFRADIPPLDGLDDRKESKEVQKKAEALAAELIGADTCHFSVNGSSLSAHVMMLAVAAPGSRQVS
jgi:arginine/lysine/ornithine decarboxylase